MNILKKALPLLACAAAALVLGGCAQRQVEVTFNPDGSGHVKSELGSAVDEDSITEGLIEGVSEGITSLPESEIPEELAGKTQEEIAALMKEEMEAQGAENAETAAPAEEAASEETEEAEEEEESQPVDQDFATAQELQDLLNAAEQRDDDGSVTWSVAQSEKDGSKLVTVKMNLMSDKEILSEDGETEEAAPAEDGETEDEEMTGILSVSASFTFPKGLQSVSGLDIGSYFVTGNTVQFNVTSGEEAQEVVLVGVLDGEKPAFRFHPTRNLPEELFSDVPEDAWYLSALEKAYDFGFVNGTTESTFSPDNFLTVGQAAILSANMCSVFEGEEERYQALQQEKGNIRDAAVAYCVEKGILNDAAELGEDLTRTATRGEMCRMFAAIFPKELYSGAPLSEKAFTDVGEDTPYADAIELLRQCGIVGGYEDGSFHPQDSVKRAHTVAFVSRIAEMINR